MPDDLPKRETAPDDSTYTYDVFISYSSKDVGWVRDQLVKQLEAYSLRVCIDFRDFRPGVPSIEEMEQAILTSRFTLIVLTPHYLTSGWTKFERLLRQTLDADTQEYRLIPVLKESCTPPISISYLTPVDFTDPLQETLAWQRLLVALDPTQKEVVQSNTGPILRFLRPSSHTSPTHSMQRSEEDVQLDVKQFKPTKNQSWRSRFFVVVAAVASMVLAVFVVDIDVRPLGSSPISIDAKLECGLGCTTMNPEGWEPNIPRVALGIHNMDQQQYQDLIKKYGQGGILTFPMTEGARVAPIPPSLESKDATNACFKTEGPTITIILSNTTRNENITVAPFPILQVKSVERLDHPVHTFYVFPEGVNFENYQATLRPMKSGDLLEIHAEGETNNLALHYLKPDDEPAALRIHLTCAAPGKYTLRLGIKYSYQGVETIAWFDKDFSVYSPHTL